MSPLPIPRSFLHPSLSFLPRGESKSPSSQVASTCPTVWTCRNWRRPFAYTSTHVRIAPSRDGRGRVCAAGQAGKRKEGEGRSWRNGRGKGRETRGRRPSVDGGRKKKRQTQYCEENDTWSAGCDSDMLVAKGKERFAPCCVENVPARANGTVTSS